MPVRKHHLFPYKRSAVARDPKVCFLLPGRANGPPNLTPAPQPGHLCLSAHCAQEQPRFCLSCFASDQLLAWYVFFTLFFIWC